MHEVERRDIEIFLTLAEELHFARTAERLGVSGARISQTIKHLERRFGAALFHRTSRQVAITPVGQALRDDLEAGYRRIQDGIAKAMAAGCARIPAGGDHSGACAQRAAHPAHTGPDLAAGTAHAGQQRSRGGRRGQPSHAVPRPARHFLCADRRPGRHRVRTGLARWRSDPTPSPRNTRAAFPT
ncbi:LysR family transcriptional regulator [Nocardia cyriacigeorgica]|uniref:LysR family transcriptional regulator n=1 Tax=Nocardia cyriacigeorgica TaxID=135487 RepID=UPI002B4ABB59|nr:LysR family transcriptional regulator [Nocardia cyriacigeorgica]